MIVGDQGRGCQAHAFCSCVADFCRGQPITLSLEGRYHIHVMACKAMMRIMVMMVLMVMMVMVIVMMVRMMRMSWMTRVTI